MALLRHLVPVLGAIALVPALTAEDKPPVVTFNGWSDNIFSVADDNTQQVGGPSEKSTQAPTARFTAVASLKATWKVNDKVTGKINAWLYPANADNTGNPNTPDPLNIREAYVLYQVTEAIGLQMGKYYSHIGWIGHEPADLFVVNPDVIGYRNTYGNDVLGAAVIVSPKDSPIIAQLHVTNGYYTRSDAYSYNYDTTTTNPHRANSDLGWGFDLTCKLPKDLGSINLEGAYDTHSDANAAPIYTADSNALGGNIAYLGLNMTLNPEKELTLGFEVQMKQTGKGKAAGDVDIGGKESLYQGMILANYVLPPVPFPMSVTLNDQYMVMINDDKYNDAKLLVAYQGKCRQNMIQAALLTNPVGGTNFGVNLEVSYFQKLYDEQANQGAYNVTGWETSFEAFFSF